MNSVNFSMLKTGEQYSFHIKDFVTPLGDTIAGTSKLRKFIGKKDLPANGIGEDMPTIPFIEVERDNGTRHLIAVETIHIVETVNNEQ